MIKFFDGRKVVFLEIFLGEGPFYLGSEISAVDFLIGKPLKNLDQLGLLSASPSLQALFDKIRSLPSFDKAYTTIAHDYKASRQLLLVPMKTKQASHSDSEDGICPVETDQ